MDSVETSTPEFSFGDCPHEEITSEGHCLLCGLCLDGVSHLELTAAPGESRYHVTTTTVPSFVTDIKELPLPPEVSRAAINLASSIPPEVHRMGVRRQMLFVFAYIASLQVGNPFKPEELATLVGITPGELNHALRLVSGTSAARNISLPRIETGVITAPVVIVSPIIYLEDLCRRYGLSEHHEAIKLHASRILELDVDHSLLSKKPIHIAVAFIKHYLESCRLPVPSGFGRGEISGTILNQRYNQINEILRQAEIARVEVSRTAFLDLPK